MTLKSGIEGSQVEGTAAKQELGDGAVLNVQRTLGAVARTRAVTAGSVPLSNPLDDSGSVPLSNPLDDSAVDASGIMDDPDGATSDAEEWVIDTGTGNDLCRKGIKGVRTARNAKIVVDTANGPVEPDTQVTVALDALNEDADCIELPDTINALTVGRRCAAHGYGFYWEPWHQKPTFLKPDGDHVDIKVTGYVPSTLISSGQSPAGNRRRIR